MKVLFGMALRQTTGFVESLLCLIGPDWDVRDFSTLSSTGIKVGGEGAWNARKHGGAKRRVWRKVHLGIDEQTLEIRAVEVTSSDVGGAPMLPELLARISADQDIASITADGTLRHPKVP